MFSWVTEVKHLFEDGLTRNMIDFFPRVEFLAKNVVNTNNENITTISWTCYLIDPFNAGPNYTPARLHRPFTVSQEIWPTTTLGFIWNRYSKWLEKWWWVIYALLNDVIISKIVHNHYNVFTTTLGLAAFNATFTNGFHVSFILFSPSVSSISSKLNFYVIFSSCWSTKAFIFSRMNLFWLKKYTNANF